jgi:transcriptional regulator with GAF, ATPase, and Fis domain
VKGFLVDQRRRVDRAMELTIRRYRLAEGGLAPGDAALGAIVALPEATAPTAEPKLQHLPTLDQLERRYLLRVLEAVKGDRRRAAEVLGVSARRLDLLLGRLGIAPPANEP